MLAQKLLVGIFLLYGGAVQAEELGAKTLVCKQNFRAGRTYAYESKLWGGKFLNKGSTEAPLRRKSNEIEVFTNDADLQGKYYWGFSKKTFFNLNTETPLLVSSVSFKGDKPQENKFDVKVLSRSFGGAVITVAWNSLSDGGDKYWTAIIHLDIRKMILSKYEVGFLDTSGYIETYDCEYSLEESK